MIGILSPLAVRCAYALWARLWWQGRGTNTWTRTGGGKWTKMRLRATTCSAFGRARVPNRWRIPGHGTVSTASYHLVQR